MPFYSPAKCLQLYISKPGPEKVDAKVSSSKASPNKASKIPPVEDDVIMEDADHHQNIHGDPVYPSPFAEDTHELPLSWESELKKKARTDSAQKVQKMIRKWNQQNRSEPKPKMNPSNPLDQVFARAAEIQQYMNKRREEILSDPNFRESIDYANVPSEAPMAFKSSKSVTQSNFKPAGDSTAPQSGNSAAQSDHMSVLNFPSIPAPVAAQPNSIAAQSDHMRALNFRGIPSPVAAQENTGPNNSAAQSDNTRELYFWYIQSHAHASQEIIGPTNSAAQSDHMSALNFRYIESNVAASQEVIGPNPMRLLNFPSIPAPVAAAAQEIIGPNNSATQSDHITALSFPIIPAPVAAAQEIIGPNNSATQSDHMRLLSYPSIPVPVAAAAQEIIGPNNSATQSDHITVLSFPIIPAPVTAAQEIIGPNKEIEDSSDESEDDDFSFSSNEKDVDEAAAKEEVIHKKVVHEAAVEEDVLEEDDDYEEETIEEEVFEREDDEEEVVFVRTKMVTDEQDVDEPEDVEEDDVEEADDVIGNILDLASPHSQMYSSPLASDGTDDRARQKSIAFFKEDEIKSKKRSFDEYSENSESMVSITAELNESPPSKRILNKEDDDKDAADEIEEAAAAKKASTLDPEETGVTGIAQVDQGEEQSKPAAQDDPDQQSQSTTSSRRYPARKNRGKRRSGRPKNP